MKPAQPFSLVLHKPPPAMSTHPRPLFHLIKIMDHGASGPLSLSWLCLKERNAQSYLIVIESGSFGDQADYLGHGLAICNSIGMARFWAAILRPSAGWRKSNVAEPRALTKRTGFDATSRIPHSVEMADA